MRNASILPLGLAAALIGAPALAQRMPDIGFASGGRGRPLSASVLDMEMVGPDWVRPADAPDAPNNPFTLDGYRFDAFAERLRAAAARYLHKPGLLRR